MDGLCIYRREGAYLRGGGHLWGGWVGIFGEGGWAYLGRVGGHIWGGRVSLFGGKEQIQS